MLQIPVPLIFLDIAISAQANSWSSALNATADMSMQMSYYNEALKLVFIRYFSLITLIKYSIINIVSNFERNSIFFHSKHEEI